MSNIKFLDGCLELSVREMKDKIDIEGMITALKYGGAFVWYRANEALKFQPSALLPNLHISTPYIRPHSFHRPTSISRMPPTSVGGGADGA